MAQFAPSSGSETRQDRERYAGMVREVHRRAARDRFLKYATFVRRDYRVAAHHEAMAEHLEAIERGEIDRLMIFMPPRHGKLISDDTPVLTSKGWRPHGDLQAGDFVCHPSGRLVEVVGVSPPGEASLEVETMDGAKIAVHPAHEWTVYDRVENGGCWRTVETGWLLGRAVAVGKKKPRARYLLPRVEAVEMPSRELAVPPYVLGAWLGDGTAGKPYLTGPRADRAVVDRIEGLGYRVGATYVHPETCAVTYSFAERKAGGRRCRESRLTAGLRSLGCLREKHIPEIYKTGSIDQRLDLIAGLVDTDGHVEPDTGRVRIATVLPRLADDIMDVARSLGWRCGVYTQGPATSSSGVIGRYPVHYVSFNPDRDIPVVLPRKRIGKFAMRRRIGIRAIRPCEPRPGKCIQVDAGDGLYCVGREMVPTHNSFTTSVLFPAWYLGRHPHREIIACSYGGDLSGGFGGRIRNLAAAEEHISIFGENAAPLPDVRARNLWITQAGGVYRAAGIGAGIAGFGAHLMLIDDPVKNREEADSPVIQRRNWDWWRDDAYPRLMPADFGAPGGAMVLIMTRWSDGDLAGRVLAEQGDEWTVLHLPAIDDAGAALWPERYPVEALERIRRSIGSRGWQSEYQGRPAPDEGLVFLRDWFQASPRRYGPEDAAAGLIRTYGMSDYAVLADDGDYTVHAVFGVDPDDNIHVLDLWRRRATPDVWVEAMLDIMDRWKPLAWAEERGGLQRAAEPYIMKRQNERQVYGYRHQIASVKDKRTRAQTLMARMASGKVFWPFEAGWFAEAQSEFLRFDAGKHDDIVDALSLGARMLAGMTRGRAPQHQNPQPATVDAIGFAPDALPEGGQVITWGQVIEESKRSRARRRRRAGRGGV